MGEFSRSFPVVLDGQEIGAAADLGGVQELFEARAVSLAELPILEPFRDRGLCWLVDSVECPEMGGDFDIYQCGKK